MKRALVITFLFSLIMFPAILFAQTAKIIDLKGQVLFRAKVSNQWAKARINMVLGKEAELQTKQDSHCTLAFDDELKNIVTLSENSHIRIQNIKPGNIFLDQGRVFSLIKDLAKSERFEVRTPTAIAGARGTGWVTGFNNGNTKVFCFDDLAYVEGLGDSDNITGEAGLPRGRGIIIGRGGALGEEFALNQDQLEEWNNFMAYLDGLTEEGGAKDDDGGGDSLDELRDDQRQDQSDLEGESRRSREEQSQGTSEITTP